MRDEQGVAEDRAAYVSPEVVYDQPDDIVAAEVLSNWRVRVRFNDGLEGVVDLSRQVHAADAGVFAALADPRVFGRVRVENGTVGWPGEIDLAPDAIHAELEANGEWVL